METIRAYSINRPVSLGTYPKGYEITDRVNFEARRYVEEIEREAWGYIDFAESVPQSELARFELVTKADTEKPNLPSKNVIRAMARDYLNCEWDRFNRKVEVAEREGCDLEALETALENALEELVEMV